MQALSDDAISVITTALAAPDVLHLASTCGSLRVAMRDAAQSALRVLQPWRPLVATLRAMDGALRRDASRILRSCRLSFTDVLLLNALVVTPPPVGLLDVSVGEELLADVVDRLTNDTPVRCWFQGFSCWCFVYQTCPPAGTLLLPRVREGHFYSFGFAQRVGDVGRFDETPTLTFESQVRGKFQG